MGMIIMVKLYEESTDSFTLSFGGNNEIDAMLLASTMNDLVNILQQITYEIEPESFIKLTVTSFRPGSFNIDIKAIVNYFKNLLNKDNLEMASKILGILLACFQIKKHLKGDKPKSVEYKEDKSVITNSAGEQLIEDKRCAEIYFKNNKIDKNITNIFNVMVHCGDRDNLTIIHNNKNNVIAIHKDEFQDMATEIVKPEDNIEKTLTNTIETNLLLKKPDLLGNSKWGFIFDKSIEATIKDEQWLHKVHTGKIKLYAGVKIPVKLLIECDYDEFMNPISTRYTVLEVTGDIIEPDEQQELQ